MGKNNSKGGDLQHALEEAAETATRDPDDSQIAADDAGGTKLAEGGGVTIRGRVVDKPHDPNLGSISGTVAGRKNDPNLGSISGTVAGKKRDPNLGSISGTVAGKKKDPNLGSISGTVAGREKPPAGSKPH